MSLRSLVDSIFARLRSWLRAVTRRDSVEEEMAAELACHLECLTADLVHAGMTPQEAERQARLQLGTALTHKEGMRASLGLRWWDELRADVRFGMRMLRKNPGFTVVAVSSLALAIGANTTIFSAAKQVLYDRLGVSHPEQLRILGWMGDDKVAVHHYEGIYTDGYAGMKSIGFSYPAYLHLKQHNSTLDDLFAFENIPFKAVVRGKEEVVDTELVTGNFYSVLGVKPQLGRGIQPSDDQAPGASPVVVISDELWDRDFGRSPAVLGQTIKLGVGQGNVMMTIVGVNPPGFTGATNTLHSPELFAPMSETSLLRAVAKETVAPDRYKAPGGWFYSVMGRMKPGVTEDQVRAQLDVELAAAVRETMPVKANETMPRLAMVDGSRGYWGMANQLKDPIHVLLVLVILVLLLACATIANLLLARGAERRREMSVRLALGAGRGRVLRQMLTESLLLASMGGAGGLLLGYLGRNLIPILFLPHQQSVLKIHFDWGIFAFVAVVTLMTGLLFGLAPAWSAAQAEVGGNLKDSEQTTTRRRKGLGGKALVSVQIALSTLLVIGAGMFLRTLLGLSSTDPGFRVDHLLVVSIGVPQDHYLPAGDVPAYQRLEQVIAAVPGVESASAARVTYISGATNTTQNMVIDEESGDPSKGQGEHWNLVGNDFFKTMGIPLIAGRAFGPQDTVDSTPVAIVNQSLARSRFPGTNPIGRLFTTEDPSKNKWVRIVGICADTRYENLREAPTPQVIFDYAQATFTGGMTYAIRTHLQPVSLLPVLRKMAKTVDSEAAVSDIQTQQEVINETMHSEIAFASLTSGFGVLALGLACVGIYGVMAYSVANRRNEIGIRLALGAQPEQVRGMILRESGRLALVGIVAGVLAALFLMRMVAWMLYGIHSYDPVTLAAAVLLLLLVALGASWIPARRASSVQPMEALRHE
jgi:predicted permease